MRPPSFEVTSAADSDGRLLVSPATIRALNNISSSGAGAIDDVTLTSLILAALTAMAKSCNLATYRALPETLAKESVRATWLPECWGWPPVHAPYDLLLPWRAPIISIEITEDGVALVENTDFELRGAGIVARIGRCWPMGKKIVVDYVAGFVPVEDDPDSQDPTADQPLPSDIVTMLGDQVRMMNDRRDIDLNLMSEDVPGVWSGTFAVAGGRAINTNGLMGPLYEALAPYRNPGSFA